MADWPISAAAAALHRDALVWDMTLPWLEVAGSMDAHVRALDRMRDSGFGFVSATAAIDGTSVTDTMKRIGRVRAVLRAHSDRFAFCRSTDDILAAKRAGKLGVGLHFQGTDPFERDLNMVQVYYDLGVRHALMAYNQKNWVGDGCHERTDGGLSRYGISLVEEMNRVGMMVDCSHTGYRTSMDVFEVSSSPVIFSHANARAIVDHPRNIRDDQAKACAKSGGVIGITGVGIFIGDNESSTSKMLDQVDYFADLVGAEHLGLGIDYVCDIPHFMNFVYASSNTYPGKGYEKPVAFATPEQIPEFTDGLLQRGYSEAQVRGVLGENWLRVAGQVWK